MMFSSAASVRVKLTRLIIKVGSILRRFSLNFWAIMSGFFSQLNLFVPCTILWYFNLYLYYCNLAWGGTYKANLQRIVILQKCVLRIEDNSTYDANTTPIFNELKLLKFHDIHSFKLGFFYVFTQELCTPFQIQ